MKTYPYHTPEGIIELVEKRELDQLLDRLAEARESHLAASARDVQTIQRQAIMLERLADALEKMLYIISVPSADPETLWRTDDEVNEAYHTSLEALAAYESATLEPVANPIDEANARLIAAAPDLLEALEAIMDSDLFEWNGSAAFWLQDKVKAALAKAKGEQL
ncbi:hypothetical protein UFOVP745_38 [uncultured Caudovirales phage]|uniref:Uncharacterized protein n=1 Tax=uncultured Caudovirales phage TaxID=2100421 RepID=A0A6J7X7D8_9CAUD|nr:hypothetical protein UFOVP745_38 [uncultured Caudovirales phage]